MPNVRTVRVPIRFLDDAVYATRSHQEIHFEAAMDLGELEPPAKPWHAGSDVQQWSLQESFEVKETVEEAAARLSAASGDKRSISVVHTPQSVEDVRRCFRPEARGPWFQALKHFP